MSEVIEKLLTSKQVGEILNVHPRTVNLWIETGKLKCPYIKLNGQASYRFKKEDIEKIMQVRNPNPEQIIQGE